MIHIDLFSGIGGFAYAIDQVWDNVNHIFCEIDPFCKQVLKKHWRGAKIYGDIREFTSNTDKGGCIYEQSQKQSTKEHDKTQCEFITSIKSPFLLTGGFPCQPFSQAGKRKGKDDDRYLWPEMLRIIKEFKPNWVIAENVAGLLSMVFKEGSIGVESQASLFGDKNEEVREYDTIVGGIERDFREAGYETAWFVIPACAVNAPHRRDRIWIIANNTDNGCSYWKSLEQRRQNKNDIVGETSSNQSNRKGRKCFIGKINTNTTNTKCTGWEKRNISKEGQIARQNKTNRNDVENTNINRTHRGNNDEERSTMENKKREIQNEGSDWERNWLEIATELCGVDDGLPTELDGFKLSKSKHREERLKALGNAIVPQVVMEIMRGIKTIMELKE
ncbi:MAG: DNA (cytosine-5-)-methyltransferase [Candidatus Omnitrophica bacterium]|nr:DNA (cytosine-5-)-methyltransferase [Candidatus Omnitrophota bacterium]MDD5589119.1 DNA (cytosine-5-)-methyltransferase [Candidatus Nanoarchaeia archaeon]